jgi:hypothetical protein
MNLPPVLSFRNATFRSFLAFGLATVMGCATQGSPPPDRNVCTLAGTVIGAFVGVGAGIGISYLATSDGHPGTNELAGITAGTGVAGAAIGALIGYEVCNPSNVPSSPPPPPSSAEQPSEQPVPSTH